MLLASLSHLSLSLIVEMPTKFLLLIFSLLAVHSHGRKTLSGRNSTFQIADVDDSIVYLWPLPKEFSHGAATLTVDPNLALESQGAGGNSLILIEAFERYKNLIFKQRSKTPLNQQGYDIRKLTVNVASDNETLQYGTDERYEIYIDSGFGRSIVSGARIQADTIYGAVRGLETFTQLCVFNYDTKTVEVNKAPWYIHDEPRFAFRGLHLDTSRHFIPVNVIKQVIESMSYAKLNVLHWHIIDEQSFPLEVPSYPDLWKGAYSKQERYTVEDAHDVVNFAKNRGIHVMAEVDIPGHAESWGIGYPDLWPSPNCTEPLDVTKDFTFELISGMLMDMKHIFPFEFFHLGGDEVNTDCWSSTPHVNQWLMRHNMTTKKAYQYFVLRAQEIALSYNWIPVNWEETFNAFKEKLNPQTVVHNWLGPGVCPKVVANGFRCIVSNQGVWYLDHLDVPWENVYDNEPLEGIIDPLQQELVLGGEVCMWSETADASNVLQTIWPRAAGAAERMWSSRDATATGSKNPAVLSRLHYFRCLLNHRGVPAAPVTNFYARSPPIGPGSCYAQ